MSISYSNLWNLLDKKGISKTEFRKLVDISTVSLAKLSKNEPVSLTIIDQICQTLKCEISDVVGTDNSPSENRWGRVQTDAFYKIALYYLAELLPEEKKVSFAYGYSVSFGLEISDRKSWELEEIHSSDTLQLWKLSHEISGKRLLTLINFAEQGRTLGEFLETGGYEIRTANKEGKLLREHLCKTRIIPEGFAYRSPFLLVPERESSCLISGLQPLHAYGNSPMYCESLVSCQKDRLYKDIQGNPDYKKMNFLHSFFQKEGFLANGFRDLRRIGDYEVFSSLLTENSEGGTITEGSPITITSLKETGSHGNLRLLGYELTVHADCLQGEYALEVILSNEDNPTAHKLLPIHINGEDVIRRVTVPEPSGSIEVRLFDMNEDSRYQLIAWEKQSLIMEIHFQMNMISRRITLEDKYVKSKPPKKHVIEHYSGEEIVIGKDNREPWEEGFSLVARDFSEIYGTENAESAFFPENTSQETFVEWLRKKVNQNSLKSVWLFDPYIDVTAMPQLVSLINDTGIKFHIVTDSANDSDTDRRIEKITDFCMELGEILAGSIELSTFTRSKSTFHDRILLLFGNGYFPQVFSLSNSLCGMAAKHSSVAAKLDRNTAAQVAEAYMDCYRLADDEGHLKTIWVREMADKTTKTAFADSTSAPDIQNLLEQKGTEGLYDEIRKSFCTLQPRTTGNNAFFSASGNSDFRKLLEQMDSYLHYPYELTALRELPYSAREAIDILLEKDFERYCNLLTEYSSDHMSMSAVLAQRCLLEAATNYISLLSPQEADDFAQKCIRTKIRVLTALGVQWFIRSDNMPMLQTALADSPAYLDECYRQLLLNLQIYDCRKHLRTPKGKSAGTKDTSLLQENANEFFDRLKEVKNAWAMHMDQDLTAAELQKKLEGLSFRSTADVCDMVLLAVKHKKISPEEAGQYLQTCLFEKADHDYTREEGSWSGKDFQDAANFIHALDNCTGEKGRAFILKSFASLEKKLLKALYDVFLSKRNYRKWKCYIDMLLWCMTMRSYCRQNWSDYNALTTEDRNLPVRTNETEHLIAKYAGTLEEYSEAYLIWQQNCPKHD